ncbi:MAG TPA: ABC transporter permease [Terriglobia bacterium]|nr:ABC transporter permease [Terriglobia bacterium]
MSWVTRLKGLVGRRKMERDLDDEVRLHLELKARANIEAGMPPAEAKFAALRAFGGVEQKKEECREVGRFRFVESLAQDSRYALRQLRRNPGFAAVAVLSLALGSGAGTALYSVIDGAFLHPFLHGNDTSVLLRARFPHKQMNSWLFSVPEYLAIRNRTHVFSSVQAQREASSVSLSIPPLVEGVSGAPVSAETFEDSGVTPLLGRAYTKEEDRPGGPRVVVLSADLWQTRFNSDPAMVGKNIRLNGQSYTVLGVMPKRYRWMGAELWFPMQLNLADTDRSHRFLFVTADLRKGVTLAQAGRELHALAASLENEDAGATPEYAGWDLDGLLVRDVIVGDLAPALLMLSGAVVLVLLITCANLGNLTLERGALRRREMAIRLAYGASPARLFRQMLTESLLLSLAGSAAGALVAYAGLHSLVGLIPRNYIATEAEIGIHTNVLLASFFAALAMGVLMGLAPALAAPRLNLDASLRGAGRNLAGEGAGRHFRRALVVSEIALAVVVLCGAGLMTRSYRHAAELPLGFDPRGVYAMTIDLPALRYPAAAQVSGFFGELVRRVRVLPGVQEASLVSQAPMAGWDVDTHDFQMEGRPLEPGGLPNADERIVGPAYYRLMGIALEQGREFTDGDRAGGLPVAIVNRTMARLYWPGRSPLGQRLRLGHGYSRARLLSAAGTGGPWLTIVGVVSDARQRPEVQWEIRPEIDLPFLQSADRIRDLSLLVKTPQAWEGIVGGVRGAMASLDAQLPIANISILDEIVADGQGPRRLALVLLAVFGGLALLLVVVGVYAVIAYHVSRRTPELGLRAAMGAQPADIRRLVLGQGMRLVLAGVALGVALAAALTRALGSLLYGVAATDPLTFAGVAAGISAVALLASCIPARRATRVDPTVALRYE